MRVVSVTAPGGPENLIVADASTPEPKPGEVLIAVAAAGVNRADLLQRQGYYPPPPGTSEVIGLEVAGTIAALGEGVDGWALGDPCVALLAGGGYAEYVVVPSGQVIAPPEGVDLITAAGLIEVAATVVSKLRPRPSGSRGDRVDPRRHRRHRQLRDPVRPGARGAGAHHGRLAGQAGAVP